MNKKTYIILLICNIELAQADTFCVNTYLELLSALTSAQSNGQSNLIKLHQGTYDLTNGFEYEATDNSDLEISGGWTNAFGLNCNVQITQDPFQTVLNGNSDRVLMITPQQLNNFTISNITFFSGFLNDSGQSGLYGAGLEIDFGSIQTFFGNVTIENNAFISNESLLAAAVFIHGDTIRFNNNLVANNHSRNGGSVFLLNKSNSIGAYVINNTVVLNTTDGTSNELIGAMRISSSTATSGYITNNIFWDNGALDLIITGEGTFYIYNNDIGSESFGSVMRIESGNISVAPLFNSGSLNFTLLSTSSLVDAGRHPLFPVPFPIPFQHDWQLVDFDLDGDLRIDGSGVDIGAYEHNILDLIFKNDFESL